MKTSQRASASIKSLHEKALETARNYIRLEKELLEIIIEIEKKKGLSATRLQFPVYLCERGP